jgi:hypothetical protein
VLGTDSREQIEILDFPVAVESLQGGYSSEYDPYLFVENVLGIPKKALVKAYLSARKEFFDVIAKLRNELGAELGIMLSYTS